MMKLTKEKIYGYSGSLFFCLLILLILWFSVLKSIIPQEEAGVLVNFGNVDEAAGMFEPQYAETQPTPEQPSTPSIQTPPAPESPVITQNIEESAAIEAAKKEEKLKAEKLKKEQEEQKRLAELEKKRKEEQQKRAQAINRQMSGAFGAGSSNETSQGTGTGSGNQGSPQGNSDQGANTGIGGYGEFSLAGRSLGQGGLPRPAYSIQEEGKIVIDITVDTKGNVILATIGKGTNIDNATMRKSAVDAAKKAKFNTISGSENQTGTITYKYNLR